MLQTPEQSALISLDSLLNICISTAAKNEQLPKEASASITSITVEEIEQFGYHTFADARAVVRGFACTQPPLTMTGGPECVRAGVTRGVEILGDRPLLLIKDKTAHWEGVNFSTRLLALVKIIE